jgi:glycerol-3-phosphate acyltransferase PlsY
MTFYLAIIIAFLLGGIPFGLLAGYLFGKGDIRRLGSGNIGATNVYRAVGMVPAVMVLIGDIGKGIAGVWICHLLYRPGWPVEAGVAIVIAGIAAILGHVFSPYLRFHGGKGVNTALGVFIYLLPLESLIALIVFVLVVFTFRFISLGSILASIVFAAAVWSQRFIFHNVISDLYLIVSVLLALFILYTHRQNIKRLISGTENRFQLGRGLNE